MRRLALIPILAPFLAVAACGEHSGWNPNYRAEATPYGNYLRAREVALTGQSEPPRVIPVALPAQAPTAEDIAGPRQVVLVPSAQLRRRGAPAIDPRVPVPVAAQPAATVSAPVAVAPVVVAPVVVAPAAPANDAPLLARYAATSRHAVGTRVWARGRTAAPTPCSRYADADAAQTAFLLRGGPAQDPLGLDPDGDGFVCGWTPSGWRNDPL